MLITFVILNVLNVIIQTAKSIVTIKCEKGIAALVNAIAYGLYTVVLVYMNWDMPLWEKVIVVGSANLIGVYVVKFFEEKSKKDKLWKIEFSLKKGYFDSAVKELNINDISYNFSTFGEYITITAFANTQEETKIISNIVKKNNAKYFITETKSF